MQQTIARHSPVRINTYPGCLRVRSIRLDVFIFRRWNASYVPISAGWALRLPFVLIVWRVA